MTSKNFLVLGALALGVGLVIVPSALAYKGDPTVLGPDCTADRHAAMTAAISKGDYQAWQKLVAGKGVATKVSESNFQEFAQSVQLMHEGRVEEAKEIRAKLGLGQGKGYGRNR